jgi:hypothetical protein
MCLKKPDLVDLTLDPDSSGVDESSDPDSSGVDESSDDGKSNDSSIRSRVGTSVLDIVNRHQLRIEKLDSDFEKSLSGEENSESSPDERSKRI